MQNFINRKSLNWTLVQIIKKRFVECCQNLYIQERRSGKCNSLSQKTIKKAEIKIILITKGATWESNGI